MNNIFYQTFGSQRLKILEMIGWIWVVEYLNYLRKLESKFAVNILDKDPLNKGFLPAIVLSFIYTG